MSQLAMCYSLANPRCSESINAYKRSKNKLIPPLLAAAQPVAVLWPTAPAPSAFSLGGPALTQSPAGVERPVFFCFNLIFHTEFTSASVCISAYLAVHGRAAEPDTVDTAGSQRGHSYMCTRPLLFGPFLNLHLLFLRDQH